MANSTASYADRIGKFKAGNTLIQSWSDYDPTNPLISAAAGTSFIASVEAANTSVNLRKDDVGGAKNDRRLLCFTLYDSNEEVGIINNDCAQQRIIRVHSYLEGILPAGHQKIDTVAAVLKKIRPYYKGASSKKSFTVNAGDTITVSHVVDGEPAKNTGGTTLQWHEVGSPNPAVPFGPNEETIINAPSGKIEIKNLLNTKRGRVRLVVESGKDLTKSPSEKTFSSIPSLLKEVIDAVEGIDPSVYDPPDPMISVSELSNLRTAIDTANSGVNNAMDAYGAANRARKELYDGKDGMTDRIRLTKSYLGSFSEGKKSNHYIEYTQALKGT